MTYSPLALLARGEARFTGDLPLPPGTLHAMVAVSPQAHARFSGIDHSAALVMLDPQARMAGVVQPPFDVKGIAADLAKLTEGKQ